MFCSKCGSFVPDNSVFCGACGNQLSSENNMQFQSQQQPQYQQPQYQQPEYQQQQYKQPQYQQPQYQQPQYQQPQYQQPQYQQPQYQQPQQEYYQQNLNNNAKDYRKLGGVLLYTTIVYIVGSIILAITGFVSGVTLLKLAKYTPGFAVLGIALFIYAGIFVLFCAMMANQIIKKNPRFLHTYHLMIIFAVILSLSICILEGVIYEIEYGRYFSSIGYYIGEGIGRAISFVVTGIVWSEYFKRSVRVRTYFGTGDYLRMSIFCKKAIPPNPQQ